MGELRVAAAIAVAFDRHNLGVVREAINEATAQDALGKMVSQCLNGKFVVTRIDFCS